MWKSFHWLDITSPHQEIDVEALLEFQRADLEEVCAVLDQACLRLLCLLDIRQP
jgi:hypothetical protein